MGSVLFTCLLLGTQVVAPMDNAQPAPAPAADAPAAEAPAAPAVEPAPARDERDLDEPAESKPGKFVFYTERDVARRLEQIWADRVRYPFWESHALRTDDGYVEFEAASRPSETWTTAEAALRPAGAYA